MLLSVYTKALENQQNLVPGRQGETRQWLDRSWWHKQASRSLWGPETINNMQTISKLTGMPNDSSLPTLENVTVDALRIIPALC